MVDNDKIGIIVVWILIFVLVLTQDTNVPTLGLDLVPGMLTCFTIGMIMTIGIYMTKGLHVESKKDVIIFVLRCIHNFVNTLHMFYIFIFSRSCDTFFSAYVILLVLHWWICGECIVTYYEKKLMNPNYRLGETPNHHEWVNVWSTEQYINLVLNIFAAFFLYNVLTVVRRSDIIPSEWMKVVIIIVIWCLFLQSSLTR